MTIAKLFLTVIFSFLLVSSAYAKDMTWHDVKTADVMSRKHYFILGFITGMSTYENIRHAELNTKTPFYDALRDIPMFEIESTIDDFYKNGDKNMAVELTIMYALMQKYGVDITKYDKQNK